MGILKTLLSLPHLADDLESEEYASAKLFGKIADLEKKIEKLEAGEPRPITKEELEKPTHPALEQGHCNLLSNVIITLR